MARPPRGLLEIKRWKATEFRYFLLYNGVVVLKTIFTNHYFHFIALLVFMSIIVLESDLEVRGNNLVYAKKLAVCCAQESIEPCGPSFDSYNVHNLIHLHKDVEYLKEDLHSVFVSSLLHQSTNPASKVVKEK